jgi:hypothetical protein
MLQSLMSILEDSFSQQPDHVGRRDLLEDVLDERVRPNSRSERNMEVLLRMGKKAAKMSLE